MLTHLKVGGENVAAIEIESYLAREVHFVEPGTWPMSATKINKRELRARLTARRTELTTT